MYNVHLVKRNTLELLTRYELETIVPQVINDFICQFRVQF